jgi:two-component system CheB/CheR fusion protein
LSPNGGYTIQVFASDLDSVAIDTARKGEFPSNIDVDVTPERLSRFFIKTDEGYRIKTEIREMVVFAQHNIIMHPPFTKIDIISCRNLLIYMDTALQNKLLGLFYYSLNPDGIIVLGSSETLGVHRQLFIPVDAKLKIFKRSIVNSPPDLFDFPASYARIKPSQFKNQPPVTSDLNIQSLADQLMLQNFSPAGVLVNANGDIIYFSGHTGKYLEPAVGKANLNIFAMLREGLRNEFPIAFRKSITKKEKVELHNLHVGTNDGVKSVNISLQ